MFIRGTELEMNLLLVNLNTVVAVLCLLMALHLFFQKTLCQLAIRLLAACFLVLGLHALFRPLAHLMFQCAFQTSSPLKPSHLLHLIPASLVFSLMLSEQGKFFADFAILLSLLGYALLFSHSSWRRKSTLQVVSEKTVNELQEFEKNNLPLAVGFHCILLVGFSWRRAYCFRNRGR